MRKGALTALVALQCGCSISKIALVPTASLLVAGRPAVLDEPDWQQGREAMPAQLALIESLLVSDPEDLGLRRLAAEGFGGGAFLFLEDAEPARAKGFYLRGRDHALAALALTDKDFAGLAALPPEELEKKLKLAGKESVPDLFWAGFSWAGYVNLSKDDASALADLPKAVALMTRSWELDPSFQHGGADLFFGLYHASRPPLLGGNPAKAKTHFEWAHRITKGQYLMTHYLNARWYAVAVQDQELCRQLLKKVLDEPSGRIPGTRLADEAAKRKAAAMMERIDDYF
ncbi:MAG: TRAP transporter TatT component family protein [Elusimicrobiota bacterium]|nr:TRAP transporter TatT component family protein [Elusimicrobiota bacterium]